MAGVDWLKKRVEAGYLFTPAAPIEKSSLFVGRARELSTLIDVLGAPGRHAVIFGDRGIGKTSLSNVFLEALEQALGGSIYHSKVTCVGSDTFASVIRQLFRKIELPLDVVKKVGFESSPRVKFVELSELLPPEPVPDDVRHLLSKLPISVLLVIDEFDRLPAEVRRRFAEGIKLLSDNLAKVTIVMVGVSQSVEQLVHDHASIERVLAQLRLPRLRAEESERIVSQRFVQLGFTSEQAIHRAMAHLSQGLPHVVHALGLHATYSAIERQRLTIDRDDLDAAIRAVIGQTDQTLARAYSAASYSPQNDALFETVLIACAMTKPDRDGFFNAGQVLPAMQELYGGEATVATFNKHLKSFATERGEILDREGPERKRRYRFKNPLMRSYILLQAVSRNRIPVDRVKYFEEDGTE